MNIQNILLENFGVVTIGIKALVWVLGDKKKTHKKMIVLLQDGTNQKGCNY